MSYIDSTLLTGEKVIYRTRLHWIIFLRPVLWFIVTALLIIFISTRNKTFDHITDLLHININEIYWFLPLITFFVGIIDCVSQYIAYISSEFGVTNKRVIVKIGFIRRTTSENFLSKIENIQVRQSVLGRILGYGNIILHGTGGTREPFFSINNPIELRKQIQQQVELSENR